MSRYVYMAGLMDGEGSVILARNKASDMFKTPYLSMSSTTREIIDWLAENFGGNVSVQKVYQDHHKQSWSWKLRNKAQLFETIAAVEPHMLEPVKKARMRLLVDEYDKVTVRNGKYTPEQVEAKRLFEEKFATIGL